MSTIRLPIVFSNDSYGIATIDEGTDEYYITILSNTMRIEQGQLPLSTSYGVTDPTFEGTTPSKLVATASQFVPEISIVDVKTARNESGTIGISVTFERRD